MSPVHGRRVVGDENYDKAVRNEVGGANTFGVRVRGSIPENGPTNIAKRATEHGPLVVAGAKSSDEKGKESEGVSVESLRNILAENPTFFDSLYEAELAREDGAREDALAIFYEVERGIKGQARQDVMDEIRTLLGAKRQTASANADRNKARLIQAEAMAKRTAENALLQDADRIEALATRSENIKRVEEAEGDDQLRPVSPLVDAQLRTIAEEHDLHIGTEEAGVVGNIPAKPPGDINPETQASGERLGVPKGTPNADALMGGQGVGGTGGGDPLVAAGVGDEGKGDENEPDPEVVRIRSMTIAQLEREAKKLKVEVPTKGSGADGAVLKKDIANAILTKMGKPTDEE